MWTSKTASLDQTDTGMDVWYQPVQACLCGLCLFGGRRDVASVCLPHSGFADVVPISKMFPGLSRGLVYCSDGILALYTSDGMGLLPLPCWVLYVKLASGSPSYIK